MSSILFVHNDLDKTALKLQHPKGIKGGAYTSVITHNEDTFYLQLPKCMMRSGIVKTEKKTYCDLLFSNDDEQVVSWFENLQNVVQELIYEKKNVWFNGELEQSDIEDTFINIIKTYRSGKNYLVRCFLPKDISTVMCYDDEEEQIALDNIKGEETIIIPLVEIADLRFTSRNFQVDLVLRELMVVSDDDDEDDEDEEAGEYGETPTGTPSEEEEVKEENINSKGGERGHSPAENIISNGGFSPAEEEVSKPVIDFSNEEDNIQLNIESTNNNIKENVEETTIKVEEPTVKEEPKVEVEATTVKEEPKVEEPKVEESKVEERNIEEKNDNGLQEVSLDLDTLDNSRSISLKSPQNVYYAIWQNAKQRLKFHRAEALKAFLEAQNIKNTYLVDWIDNDSDDEFRLQE